MKGKEGEIHQRKKFIDLLEEKLNQSKYSVYQELTVRDIRGNKLHIPDVTIVRKEFVRKTDDEIHFGQDAVACVIETKKKKNKSIEGVEQALRYMETLECGIGFSTNFLDMVGIDTRETAPKVEYYSEGLILDKEKNLRKLVNTILDVTEDKKVISPIAKNDDVIIQILTNAVHEITQFTKKAPTEDIESAAGLFMAKKFDKTTLSGEQKEELTEDIQRAAAYLIVNQILFYHTLSKEIEYYPELEEIREMKALSDRFDRVLEDDYRPVFTHQLVDKLPKETINSINSIIRVTKDLKLEQLRRDLLGKIFHNFIPTSIRKRIAAYFTSNAAGLLLSNLSIFDKHANVIDIACGSGTLLVSAYERKKEFYGGSGAKIHQEILKDLHGIDISIFASHLAAIHLALQEPLTHTEDVNIYLNDALLINPGTHPTFDYYAKEMVRSTSDGLEEGKAHVIPKCDLVIMNPPFTQSRRMEEKYKDFLKKVIRNADWEDYLFQPKIVERKPEAGRKTKKEVKYTPGWLNLHTIFLVHAHDFLKKGGRISAVLPAQTFSADYSEGIKKFFDESYHIEYFITSEAQNTFSVDCDWKEILLVAKRTSHPKEKDLTKFVTLKEELTIDNYKELAKLMKEADSQIENEKIRINLVERGDLLNLQNWMSFCYSKDLYDVVKEIREQDNLIYGADLFEGKLTRGIEPRGAKFYFLPNKDWKLVADKKSHITIRNKSTRENLRIKKEVLHPTLRSPKKHNSDIKPKPTYYFLSVPKDYSIRGHLRNYFKWGEYMAKTNPGYISNIEDTDWENHIHAQIESKKPFGNVVMMKKFKPDSRGVYAQFITKDNDVAAPNTFYSYFVDDDDKAKALVGYENSIFFLIQILFERNVLSKSSEELTEGRLEELYYLDIFSLDKEKIQEISNVVDELADTFLPPIYEQLNKQYRKKLDMAVAKALNIQKPEEKIEEYYKFYETIINKCYDLKNKPKYGTRF